jgi:hypothetical protein
MATRILRGLWSARLACGCSVGVYETYAGAVINVVDAHHPGCARQDHREGQPVGSTGRADILAAGPVEPASGGQA